VSLANEVEKNKEHSYLKIVIPILSIVSDVLGVFL